jgi:hyperosmotically inducible protein
MNMKLVASCLMAGALMLPIAGYAAGADSAKTIVKDSAITTKIKAELAEEKVSSLVKISVVTDNKGMVTLSGTASNQEAVDKAASIARAVKGVTSVENHIQIEANK